MQHSTVLSISKATFNLMRTLSSATQATSILISICAKLPYNILNKTKVKCSDLTSVLQNTVSGWITPGKEVGCSEQPNNCKLLNRMIRNFIN